MKSYESEKEELNNWMRERTRHYYETDAKWRKEHGNHRDSEPNKTFLFDVQEYNRRLRELKEKYGIE